MEQSFNFEKEVEKDVDYILWSTKLCGIFRFTKQRFWEEETLEHEYIMRMFGNKRNNVSVPRTESVAEHSWHMADIAMLLAPKFSYLDIGKCLMIATLHDKLEIITGDQSPIGKNGKGNKTHAFNEQKKTEKDQLEIDSLSQYKKKLNPISFAFQEKIIMEAIELSSPESRFVKALDRIQPLAYIILKKDGIMENKHIEFTLRYSATYMKHFPELAPHYNCLIHRLLETIAKRRKISLSELKTNIDGEQLKLFSSF
ncbi:HD family hydrolase [Fibrella sp. WM1]|uniref:HD domain-containing protein n=1 Tax=Fibrella musci TaxID=3242485 RepID=UPI00352275BC